MTIHTLPQPRILNTLNITPQPGLTIRPSRDDTWLTAYTPQGIPADYCIEWTETAIDALGDTDTQPHYLYGTFADIHATIADVMGNPALSPDGLVEVDVSEWAAHYLRAA